MTGKEYRETYPTLTDYLAHLKNACSLEADTVREVIETAWNSLDRGDCTPREVLEAIQENVCEVRDWAQDAYQYLAALQEVPVKKDVLDD